MMFSRMAPTVLFTAFCVAATGAYIVDGAKPLTRPGTPSDSYFEAMNAFTDEITLALQVGDYDRFTALLDAQVGSAGEMEDSVNFQPDTLPAPHQQLRRIVMRGAPQELRAYLAAHPSIALNTPLGRYGSVPLFWAAANYRHPVQMMELLLAAGADPGVTTQRGYNLAHAIGGATTYGLEGHWDAVLDLLPEPALHARTQQGMTPFQLALINGQAALARHLLERGAGDANARVDPAFPYASEALQPPLILARSNVPLVEALLFAGADPLALDADGVPVAQAVAAEAARAEASWQERLKASEGEEYDRKHAADYRRVRDIIRAAADGRLAKDQQATR